MRPASSTPCCAGWGSATRRRGCSSSRRTPSKTRLGHMAFAHAHPRWIAQAFADALGGEAELDEALGRRRRPPGGAPARPARRDHRRGAGARHRRHEAPYSPYGVHLEPGGGDVGDLDAVAEGLATVQDEGSQLVALALTRAPLIGADTGRWLDLCAGPGGKSVLLGSLLALDGGRFDAVEPSEHRADLVRRAADGLPVDVHTADGREAPLPDGAYDRVLVDAPCTGLGALRRRPEARWRRRPDDVAALAKLQRELLTAALRHVRPGGVVALHHVLAAPRRDPRRAASRTAQPRRRGTARRASDCCPACRTSVRARACSCGRTGTAPTRCSSGCCAGRARSLLPCLR